MMNKISAVLFSVLLAHWKVAPVVSLSEPYVYAIYYADECQSGASFLRGYASDQAFRVHGANGGSCQANGACMLFAPSPQCQAKEFIKEGEAIFTINDDGLVLECDNTNANAECSFLDQCYSSSTFPGCSFQAKTTSDLTDNPSLIKSTSTTDDPEAKAAYDETSYLIYYSDEECTSLEGIDGVVNDATNTLAVTADSVSCRDAMACAFHYEPGDDAACLKVIDSDTIDTIEMTFGPISDADESVVCTMTTIDDGTTGTNSTSCEPVPSTTCQKSTIHSSCYYKIVPAATLFGSPDTFLTLYNSDPMTDVDADAGAEGEEEGSGSSGNPDEAAGTTNDKETPESSTSGSVALFFKTRTIVCVTMVSTVLTVMAAAL